MVEVPEANPLEYLNLKFEEKIFEYKDFTVLARQNGPKVGRLPNTSSLSFRYARASELQTDIMTRRS